MKFPLFFKKKNQPLPEDIVKEHFQCSFNVFSKHRFSEEEAADYACYQDKSAFYLKINKEDCFAWTIQNYYQYDNFHLEADLSFEKNQGYASQGFILRYHDNENFYYFLVSSKGYFRFDLVFNGNPIPLIDWTVCKFFTQDFKLEVLCDGPHFSFFLNENWLADCYDSTLTEGNIGYAGQNYHENQLALLEMKKINLESRITQLEKISLHLSRDIVPGAEGQLELAKTWYSQGAHSAAVSVLNALFMRKDYSPNAEAYLLLARCLMQLKLYKEAEEALESALKISPEKEELILEKAGLLYISNQFLRLRDFLQNLPQNLQEMAPVSNLLGHAFFSLGNWKEALKAYSQAFELDNSQGIYIMHKARCLEHLGKIDEAVEEFLKAASLFIQSSNWQDISIMLPRIKRLSPEDPGIMGLEAKLLFEEQQYTKASDIMKNLIDKDCNDSAIFYLYGIILNQDLKREQALEYFQKALEIEPNAYLYHFRLAEGFFALNRLDEAEKHINTALEIKPDDKWVLNQAAIQKKALGDFDKSTELFKSALEINKDDIIQLNYADLLHLQDKKEEAYAILDELEDSRLKLKIHADLLISDNKAEEALGLLQKAIRDYSDDADILANAAKLSMELDFFSQADEYLGRALQIQEKADYLNLVASLASLRGEAKRAETALQRGLELEPENSQLLLNLAQFYLGRYKYQEAKEIILKLLENEPQHEKALELQKRVREKLYQQLECSDCKREWWVPQDIGRQSGVKIVGMPPEDAPAGRCPTCLKIFCIECASKNMQDKRFICPDCGEFLKLSSPQLIYLINQYLEKEEVQ